jgi:hypothetical protein
MEVAMPDVIPTVHQCRCSLCKEGTDPAIVCHHQQMNLLLSRLNEPQRRWYVATLSLAPNAPTDRELARITGLDEKTIRRGRYEMQYQLSQVPDQRQRQEGGERPAAEKKIQP